MNPFTTVRQFYSRQQRFSKVNHAPQQFTTGFLPFFEEVNEIMYNLYILVQAMIDHEILQGIYFLVKKKTKKDKKCLVIFVLFIN
jgi:hypothetical protein